MKKSIFFILYVLFVIPLIAQNIENLGYGLFSNYGGDISWEFENNILTIHEYKDNYVTEKKFDYLYENKGPYFNLRIKNGEEYKEYVTLLAPHNEFFLLYPTNGSEPLENGFFGKNSLLFSYNTRFKIRNYLTEGKIKYVPENLSDLSIGKPWVEGCDDSGIGERIYINHSTYINSLIISNGFVSFKVSTYYNNNRVKLLRVYNSNNTNEFFTVELPDNAIPFEIKLPFQTNIVELEILDVYKGDKYDDTCINFILCKSNY